MLLLDTTSILPCWWRSRLLLMLMAQSYFVHRSLWTQPPCPLYPLQNFPAAYKVCHTLLFLPFLTDIHCNVMFRLSFISRPYFSSFPVLYKIKTLFLDNF
ncbi:hypothetical protein BKA57DRAFT_125676 [Linnemannia elongata]|nr:hypothetical protein BKA57DRAFT_125676 [Linnemannia elongata]